MHTTAHWKQFPLGPSYDKALALLQSVLGKGVAPALADIPNVVAGGYFDGGVQVGSELSERLLMELGGNMEVGWGKVTNYQQVYEMLTVHATVTHISNVVPALQKQYGASITQYVLNALDGKPGSQVRSWRRELCVLWGGRQCPLTRCVVGVAVLRGT